MKKFAFVTSRGKLYCGMNDRISASCENVSSATLKVAAECQKWTVFYILKRWNILSETIGDGIATCYEMLLVIGYISHSLWIIKDQLYNVESNSELFGHTHSLPQYYNCSENSVWLDLQYCISGFKLFTSHIDKYWPLSQIFSSF